MGNLVTPTDSFERKVKRLLKKFPTLSVSLLKLEEELIENPFSGNKLSNNLYKVRLADKSKGKGKSGGFRVITYLVKQTGESIEVFLLTIYDKSELDTLSSVEIKDLIEEVAVTRRQKR